MIRTKSKVELPALSHPTAFCEVSVWLANTGLYLQDNGHTSLSEVASQLKWENERALSILVSQLYDLGSRISNTTNGSQFPLTTDEQW